jgi:hypothetical protein
VTTPTAERARRAELLTEIEQAKRHHPYACSGCSLEQAEKELEQIDRNRTAAIEKLIAAGTPSDHATRLVDVLAKHGFAFPDLPGSAHGATIDAILADLTPAERITLGDLISGGSTAGWPRWLDAALDRVNTDDRIAVEREVLSARINEASKAIYDVQSTLGFLIGLGDDDYTDDDLLTRFIVDADRAIRAAQRINPHR